MKYLLDTNGLIYLLSKKGKFPDFMKKDELFLSFITYIEILAGIEHKKTKAEVKLFMHDFQIIYPDEEITEITLKFRKNLGLKIPDAIIGATALYQKAILITADREMIKKLSSEMKIINPLNSQ